MLNETDTIKDVYGDLYLKKRYFHSACVEAFIPERKTPLRWNKRVEIR